MTAAVSTSGHKVLEPGKREVRRTTGLQDERAISDAFRDFSNPNAASGGVVLIRPFAVMSRNSYSTPITPPIGIAYLAGVMEKAGYPVTVIDSVGENIHKITASECGRFNLQGLSAEETVSRIPGNSQIIGISMMFTQEWVEHRKLINMIRQKFPDAVIVAGGEHSTAMPEYILRDCPAVNYVAMGEGEMIFLEMVHSIMSGKQPESIGGIAYIDRTGTYVGNGLGRRIMHFNELPRPAWHLCPVDSYFIDNWTMGIAHGRNMPILASRGCPYQCTFCSNPFMWTTRYKLRPVTEVVDEIEWLIATYKANSIDFFDLTAIVKKEWILEFCKELERRKISIIWQLPSGTRSEALDEEVLQSIYEANCQLLVYAPESGSQRSLEAIKKKLKLDRLLHSVDCALRIGHTVKVNFIIGFPHEDMSDVKMTLKAMFKLALSGVHDCNLAIFTPYPGSELYEDLRSDGSIPEVNDGYIADLILQFDFTVAKSHSPHLSGKQLVFWRAFGQFGFYVLSYGIRPWRAFNVLKGIVKPGTLARNLFEQRIFDFFARRRLVSAKG